MPPLDASGRPMLALGPEAPEWAVAALADSPEECRVDVAGTNIETLVWGSAPAPGLLLSHGHGAHADWWRAIAPQLVGSAGKVVAWSMSGMGGSDWRDAYSHELFAEELLAVARATGTLGGAHRPWLVAHSFGCLPTIMAAEQLGEAIAGIVLIDFYSPPPGRSPAQGQVRKLRRYNSFAAAMSRFRLSPEQDSPNPWLVDFVGRRTLRRAEDGWTWLTDPAATIRTPHDRFRTQIGRISTPLILVRGERSRLVDAEVTAHVRGLVPHAPLIDIPDADHHVLLDRPLALVAMLRTLFALEETRYGR